MERLQQTGNQAKRNGWKFGREAKKNGIQSSRWPIFFRTLEADFLKNDLQVNN